jgi:hypothetical protein
MSSSDEFRPEEPTARPAGNPAERRRGRLVIPLLVLLIIVVVFLVITLVGGAF